MFKSSLDEEKSNFLLQTRILVTHGVHWLPKVDLIVVMDNGTISEVGSYEELMQEKGAFSQFLEAYLLQEDEEDSESKIMFLFTVKVR